MPQTPTQKAPSVLKRVSQNFYPDLKPSGGWTVCNTVCYSVVSTITKQNDLKVYFHISKMKTSTLARSHTM